MKLFTVLTAALTYLVIGQALADGSDISRFTPRDRLSLDMLRPGAGFSNDKESKEALSEYRTVPWLALLDGPNGRLERRTIKFKHQKPDASGSGPELTVQEVGNGRKALMLLWPYPGLRSGPVQRWLGPTSFSDVTDDRPLHVHGNTTVILERDQGEFSTAPDAATTSCRLVLVSGNGHQVLDHPNCIEVDGKLSIIYSNLSVTWAGDLDHDGKPDFIFMHDGESSFYLLALSSAAGDNEMIRIVEVYGIPDWC